MRFLTIDYFNILLLIVFMLNQILPRPIQNISSDDEKEVAKHLLNYSSLYIGDGATVAMEAALLGVPSIYVSSIRTGYLDFLESRGLCISVTHEEEVLRALDIMKTREKQELIRMKS